MFKNAAELTIFCRDRLITLASNRRQFQSGDRSFLVFWFPTFEKSKADLGTVWPLPGIGDPRESQCYAERNSATKTVEYVCQAANHPRLYVGLFSIDLAILWLEPLVRGSLEPFCTCLADKSCRVQISTHRINQL